MKAKPFIKWVGGKGQLIEQLDVNLPADFGKWNDVTYIEPFVGGGAMLFYMLQKYPNIKKAVINDINPDLTTCYKTVKDHVNELIESLHTIENEYLSLSSDEKQKEFFLATRERYNDKNLAPIENTTKFFFLINYASNKTLFYFDPPYRPLSDTSSFNDYAKEVFNDDAQIRLNDFCDKIHNSGFNFMLSNSDCKGKNENDTFFDVLFSDYRIKRVLALRSINSNPTKRVA